jgi:hypothetical protein
MPGGTAERPLRCWPMAFEAHPLLLFGEWTTSRNGGSLSTLRSACRIPIPTNLFAQ